VEEAIWPLLAEPFPEAAIDRRVVAVSKDRKRAQVVPVLRLEAAFERLDEAVGPDQWSDSYELLAHTGGRFYVKCRLFVAGVSKEGAGEGASLKEAFADAFLDAARRFGLGRELMARGAFWVDYDESGGPVPAKEPEKPEAHQLIDRLLERLKEMGKGKEAARILTRYGGYGATPEETKRLYGELRALLKE